MGPIIEAIDAGHYASGKKGGLCETCDVRMPCPVMKRARVQQVEYARVLAHSRSGPVTAIGVASRP